MCVWVGGMIEIERDIVIDILKRERKRQEKRGEKVSDRRQIVR